MGLEDWSSEVVGGWEWTTVTTHIALKWMNDRMNDHSTCGFMWSQVIASWWVLERNLSLTEDMWALCLLLMTDCWSQFWFLSACICSQECYPSRRTNAIRLGNFDKPHYDMVSKNAPRWKRQACLYRHTASIHEHLPCTYKPLSPGQLQDSSQLPSNTTSLRIGHWISPEEAEGTLQTLLAKLPEVAFLF